METGQSSFLATSPVCVYLRHPNFSVLPRRPNFIFREWTERLLRPLCRNRGWYLLWAKSTVITRVMSPFEDGGIEIQFPQ